MKPSLLSKNLFTILLQGRDRGSCAARNPHAYRYTLRFLRCSWSCWQPLATYRKQIPTKTLSSDATRV